MRMLHLACAPALLLVLLGCSERKPTARPFDPQQVLARLEQYYSFSFPSNRSNLKCEEWTYSSSMEQSQTTVSLASFDTDPNGASKFLSSFSGKPTFVSGFKPVKLTDLATRVPWWRPHEFETADFLTVSKQAGPLSGAFDAYVITTTTNTIVFLSSFLVKH